MSAARAVLTVAHANQQGVHVVSVDPAWTRNECVKGGGDGNVGVRGAQLREMKKVEQSRGEERRERYLRHAVAREIERAGEAVNVLARQ
jgi:hypothetical protein